MERKRIVDRLREPQIFGRGEWQIMPMMPLRGVVVFPHMLTQLDAGRDRSINAIDQSMEREDNLIFLAMQKDPQMNEPEADDLFEVGTVACIRQLLKLPGGTMRLLVEGQYRARRMGCLQDSPYIMVELLPLKEEAGASEIELEAYARVLKTSFENYAKVERSSLEVAQIQLENIYQPDRVADLIAGHLPAPAEDRQELLETLNIAQRMEKTIRLLDRETEIVQLEQNIGQRVRQQMEKSQKDYYLREQIKAIQIELGEEEDRAGEVAAYREKAEAAQLPDYVMERVETELKRLAKTPPQMAEAMVITNYLDTILALPWNNAERETPSLDQAEAILDEDHYGLKDPKERILEYLAACQLKNNLRGPILCLVGPPGVGKTSLGKSIARATNRQFVRMSLGGVRDEAEIRGHRRTYIGAMPGRIIAGLRQAGVKDPLFLLDEVDKLSSDWRGDPTSALLEALDPEQNNSFSDHYLELPYDLSQVMFITTANYRNNIPRPLQDRMEIIEISSYTEEEKLAIAKRHLLPKQIEEHGLAKSQLKISSPALRGLIRGYTRESGVRELERRMAKICRRVGRDLVKGEPGPFRVTNPADLNRYLGAPRYVEDKVKKSAKLGQASGLAWTEVGGEMLIIEVQTLPGKGKFTITGQLGDVMKESVQAAYTYLRSIGQELNIPDNIEEKTDIHVHVPEGAVPKDGPSAGITIATALASQFSGRLVRGDIAMTGEITLHGEVLAVGGVKEKLLAAWRHNIREIILPQDCAKDLEDLPANVRDKMTIHLVRHMKEALALALLPAAPKPNGAELS